MKTRTVEPGSSERFGYEWNRYSELYPEYEELFRGWTSALPSDIWQGKTFLDAGCGMGRNSYWVMRSGAAGGTAIDIDEYSLEAARRTLAEFSTVQVEHRSMYNLPQRDQFDIAFSIGVIHHLEYPQRALEAVVRSVKPGGHVLIWVYGRENNRGMTFFLNPLRKLLFSRLPIGFVHGLSALPAGLLWVFLRAGAGRIEYFRLLRRFKFRHLRSIVFDQMLPRIAHYWPKETVCQLMEGAGLKDVKLVWVNELSWSAAGTRPAESRSPV